MGAASHTDRYQNPRDPNQTLAMMRLYLGLKTRYSGLSTRLVISVTQLSVLLNTKNHLFVQSISSSKLGAQKLLIMNSVSDPDQDKIWSHKNVNVLFCQDPPKPYQKHNLDLIKLIFFFINIGVG